MVVVMSKCGTVALVWHADTVMDCSSPACVSSTTWAQACRVPPPYHPLFSGRPTLPTTSFSALVPMLALLSRNHFNFTCKDYSCNTRTCNVDAVKAALVFQSNLHKTQLQNVDGLRTDFYADSITQELILISKQAFSPSLSFAYKSDVQQILAMVSGAQPCI